MPRQQTSVTDPNAVRFIKFLGFARSAIDRGLITGLSDQEIKVLNNLAQSWLMGEQITVLNAIRANDQSVQATISKMLKLLRQKGYIEFDLNEDDNRVKYVRPTALTMKYFAAMGKCLVKAQA